MKRPLNFGKAVLAAIFILLAQRINSQAISPFIFGQNAWMPDTIGTAAACSNTPCVLYGKLHKQWSNIKLSGASIIRFGGIAPDKNRPTNHQYIKMIDSIRAKGMEPIMQVPFHNYQYTAQQAAAIVQFVNVTKAKKIKYWIIGNEPDLDYSFTTAAQVAAYFKPFASAMKAVDPTILTIGPECAWYNTGIINGLTTPNGPDDITGKDANGRYYCDIISFHSYSFNGTQTRAQLITKLAAGQGLDANLSALNTRINNCNSVHGRSGTSALKTAITEANVDYQNASTDDLYGVGANSFIGGQFVAEMFSVGMKRGVSIINLWSVIEGNTTALNIGYIDPSTGKKKPLYHHFKLLADNFKGNYISGSANLTNVKTFGCQTSSTTCVMIMNEDLTGNFNFTLRLNTNSLTATNSLKINIAANINADYTDVIQNQSTLLLTFNAQGQLIRKCVYSLANHAALNLAPTCENFAVSPLPISLIAFDYKVTNNNSVVLSWKTASEVNNDYFKIERSEDGITFKEIGTVSGAGTTHELNSYEYTDNSAIKGTLYYRLRQMDYDGSYTYSEIISVILNPLQSEVLVYPNPNDGSYVTIKISNLSGNSLFEARLVDWLGKEIPVISKLNSTDSVQELTLTPAVVLPQGIYLINLILYDEVRQFKLVVK